MTRTLAAACLTVLAVVLTVGCSSRGDDNQQTVVVTATRGSVEVPGSPTEHEGGTAAGTGEAGRAQGPACSGLTGAQAVSKWVGEVPTTNGWAWNPSSAVTDGCDQCAALSWIVLPIQGGTASSPYAIMLFHGGQYLGTATAEPQGFSLGVKRISDAAVEVTYRFPKAGDSNANPSGTAVSQFTWDAQQNKVVHTGQLPDDVKKSGGASSSGPGAHSGQVGGDCGSAPNGWPVSAGYSTSCDFAIATAIELAKIGAPSPNHVTNPFPVVSPVTGETYTMTCSGGSDGHGGGCHSVNGGAPSAHIEFS